MDQQVQVPYKVSPQHITQLLLLWSPIHPPLPTMLPLLLLPKSGAKQEFIASMPQATLPNCASAGNTFQATLPISVAETPQVTLPTSIGADASITGLDSQSSLIQCQLCEPNSTA